MTFTAASGQTADSTDFGRTFLEPALQGQLNSVIIKNLMCIVTVPHPINEQENKISTTRFTCLNIFLTVVHLFSILDHQRFIFAYNASTNGMWHKSV